MDQMNYNIDHCTDVAFEAMLLKTWMWAKYLNALSL